MLNCVLRWKLSGIGRLFAMYELLFQKKANVHISDIAVHLYVHIEKILRHFRCFI